MVYSWHRTSRRHGLHILPHAVNDHKPFWLSRSGNGGLPTSLPPAPDSNAQNDLKIFYLLNAAFKQSMTTCKAAMEIAELRSPVFSTASTGMVIAASPVAEKLTSLTGALRTLAQLGSGHWQQRVPEVSTVMICRSRDCTPIAISMLVCKFNYKVPGTDDEKFDNRLILGLVNSALWVALLINRLTGRVTVIKY